MIDEVQRVKVEDKQARTGKTYTTDTELVKVVNPDTGIVEVRKKQKEGYTDDVDYGPFHKAIAKAQGEPTPRTPNRAERRRNQQIHNKLLRKMHKQQARKANG